MNDDTKEITITRTFSVPRERVWKAWSDPQEIAQWWGPKGVTNPVCEVNLTQGGRLHIVMLAGSELGPLAGQEWPMQGEFQEITEPEKLVFTNQAIDENGAVLIDGLTTVVLEEENGGTKMTLTTSATGKVPQAAQMIAGMEAGWTQSIDKLENFLSA